MEYYSITENPLDTRLGRLIADESLRYGTQDRKFAFAFEQPTRYEGFLRVCLNRFVRISAKCAACVDLYNARNSDPKRVEHVDFSSWVGTDLDAGRLFGLLHLEVESFYLFAKIFLDHVARVIENNFGPVRSLSLDSWDDLTKRIIAYAQAKELSLPDGFLNLAQQLKKTISDVRDYNIAHSKSPRRSRSTSRTAPGPFRMVLQILGQKPPDEPQLIPAPTELIGQIDEVISRLFEIIEINREKSKYFLAKQQRARPAQ